MFLFSKIFHSFELSFESVHDNVSIGLVTSCEHHHLVVLTSLFQTLICVRSNVDSCIYGFACGESDRYLVVIRCVVNVIYTVHQGFVKV